MRVGKNPMSRTKVGATYKLHRVVIPVYIPNAEGYYERSVEVLRLCLDTLLATIDPARVSVTVINNASSNEVERMLFDLFNRGCFDRYIRHQINRGKPDAVAGEILASHEEFVTIADSDVLFLQGWLEEVEKTFAAFPHAGSVSPFPAPKQHFYYSANTWLAGALGLSLRKGTFASSEDLSQFAQSIGKPDFYDRADRVVQFAVKHRDRVALIGGGHFVVTLRRRAYDGFAYRPGLSGLGAGIEKIDEQVERAGYMRISTPRAWVLHMGNTPEAWMRAKAAEVLSEAGGARSNAPPEASSLSHARPPTVILPYLVRRLMVQPFRFYAGLVKRRLRRSIPPG